MDCVWIRVVVKNVADSMCLIPSRRFIEEYRDGNEVVSNSLSRCGGEME